MRLIRIAFSAHLAHHAPLGSPLSRSIHFAQRSCSLHRSPPRQLLNLARSTAGEVTRCNATGPGAKTKTQYQCSSCGRVYPRVSAPAVYPSLAVASADFTHIVWLNRCCRFQLVFYERNTCSNASPAAPRSLKASAMNARSGGPSLKSLSRPVPLTEVVRATEQR